MTNQIKENIDRLLSTEMDRATFVRSVGLAMLAAVGVTAFMKAITQSSTLKSSARASRPEVPGARKFGE